MATTMLHVRTKYDTKLTTRDGEEILVPNHTDMLLGVMYDSDGGMMPILIVPPDRPYGQPRMVVPMADVADLHLGMLGDNVTIGGVSLVIVSDKSVRADVLALVECAKFCNRLRHDAEYGQLM